MRLRFGGFRDHLRGRLAWIGQLNVDRYLKLRALFDAIDWTELP